MNTRGRVREALKKSLDSVISKSSQEKNSEYLRRKRYKENDRSIISSPNKNEYQKKTKKSAIDSISDIKENSHKLSSLSNDDSFVDNLMHWRQELPPGTGFRNLGNTCFLNSVLQCILYTAPLKNYFDLSDHSSNCKIKGVCFICEYGKLSHMSEKNKTPITPQNIIQNIKNIAHHIKIGRQEDAHEFLLYFISAMENSAIKYALSLNRKFNKFKNPLIEENLIQKIFGGTITSSVTCGKCKHSSNKIDKFIDISLELSQCSSLIDSFKHFTKPESLKGNNKYYCDKCKKHNDSTKKLSFLKFPRILLVHLKRFDNYQRKIKKFLQYPSEIDLTRFKVNSKGEKCLYKLCSLLIHQGNSIDSGHYYCYVRAPNNIWYLFNDTSVKKVDQSEVLKQSPYLLFYEKVIDRVKIKSSPRKQERISLSPRKDFNIEVRISRSCSRNNSDKNYKRNLTNTQAARSLRSKRTK